MKGICDYCNNFFNIKAEQGITYIGIDEHHNPPQFMFEKDEKWNGKIPHLCRKHHRELHDKIIKILNKEARMLKFIKSEYWIWIRMNLIQRKEARKKVYEFTKEWLKKGEKEDNENSKTII